MEWIEIAVEVDPEGVDAVAALLESYGHQGVAIEGSGESLETWEDEIRPAGRLLVKIYVPADESAPDKQRGIRAAVEAIEGVSVEFKDVREEDWAEAWKAHYKPLRVGQRIYIRPGWIEVDDARPDDVLIALDPGMAFGTGTHESTQLCLEALERASAGRPGLSVLDLGCGSGILAIAAVKLGAAKVLALDIDPLAVLATQENAEVNAVGERITAMQGSLETVRHSARRFDVALVNILAKAIILMCGEGLGQVIRPGGIGIFAGLIADQADEVAAALRATGLEPYARYTAGEWVCIEARRDSSDAS